MIREKCPGEDSRNLRQEILACPGCSYQVELFSDEYGRSCPRCGHKVYRDKRSSCADWCAFAKECLS